MKMHISVISNDIKESTSALEVKEDCVTKCMGSFGLWQAIICCIAASTRFIAMWNLLSNIFLVPPTDFICVNFRDNQTEVKTSECYNDCVEYEYHNNVFETTLVSKFGLICENAWLTNFTQTMMMFGVLIGSWLFGWISDRFGRRNGLRLATFIGIAAMFPVPYSVNFWIFTGLRMIIGSSAGGIFVISALYMIETVGTAHLNAAGSFSILPDGFSEILLSVFAYFSRTWDVFLFMYWAVSVCIFLFVIILPETPRWLISKGNIDRAVDTITRGAKLNKFDTTNIREIVSNEIESIRALGQETKKWTYFDLFRTKELRLRSLCIFTVFIVSGFGFYGINQYVTIMGNNIYLSTALLGLIQVPVSLFSLILNKLFGRRTVTMSVFAVAGASMLTLIFIPNKFWLSTVLGVIGMAAISTSFAVIYIYKCELFPTPLRNMAFGFATSGAKVGSMVAPFVATLQPGWVPSLVFAIFSFLAVAVCCFLPETKGQELKHVVD